MDNYGYLKKGCWYLCENLDFSIEESTYELIQYIQKRNNIKNENVILGGSSKGGFASLYYGVKYKFCHIIAAAPQVFLGNYLTTSKNFEKILEGIGTNDIAFNKKLFNDILIELPINPINKFYFFCGVDDYHLKEHVIPIVKKIYTSDNSMYIEIFEGGHNMGNIFGLKFNKLVKDIINNSTKFTSKEKLHLLVGESLDIEKIETEFNVVSKKKDVK